jgi:hypothetical protein
VFSRLNGVYVGTDEGEFQGLIWEAGAPTVWQHERQTRSIHVLPLDDAASSRSAAARPECCLHQNLSSCVRRHCLPSPISDYPMGRGW